MPPFNRVLTNPVSDHVIRKTVSKVIRLAITMSTNLRYLRWSVLRRLPVFLSILLAIGGTTLIMAERLPERYTATARLLLQSSDIARPVTPQVRQSAEAAQAQIIEQRLMTDKVLREIGEEHGLISGNPASSTAAFRRAVTVQTRSGRDRATLISVSFSDPDPTKTRQITNALAERMLSDSSAVKDRATEERLRFHQSQVAQEGAVLQTKSDALSSFMTANADTLPDVLDRHLDRQTEIEDQLRGTSSFAPRLRETSDQRALSQLHEELNEAEALFTQSHPYLKMLQAKIELARRTVEANKTTLPTQDQPPLRTTLEEELKKTRALIAQTPKTAATLKTLERERDLAEVRYTNARAQLASAERGAQVNFYNQGDRLTIIEEAVQPVLSSGKRRKLFLLIGTALAIFMACMSIAILNRLDRTIRRADMLQHALGISAFAVLPDLQTQLMRR